MTRIREEDRKRKRRPKSKTGCAACKARHVKCDETRPHCRQCTSHGQFCPGYAFDPSKPGELRMQVSTSASVFESRSEHRAFTYFHRYTSEHLAGLVESEIWSRALLQIARTDSSVRHALIALASVHEDYEQASKTGLQTNIFALRQYNRAVRGHAERSQASQSGKGDVEAYLASCMIFICIEMLQSHPASAISLIKQAVSLFYSLPAVMPGGPPSSWPLEMFEALLCRFQFMAMTLVGRATYDGTVPPRMRAANMPPMPRHFNEVRQAKEYLDFYLFSYELSRRASSKGYIRDPTEQDAKAVDAIVAYRDILVRWSSAFDALKFRCNVDPNLSERDRRALDVLDIRHRFLTRLANFSEWDHAKGTFNEILDLIESIVARLKNGCPFSNSKHNRLFTLELGLISPLYMVARGCRDPHTRRRAIAVLKAHDIREGLWCSSLAATIAERIMHLEEEATGKEIASATDVPHWARIPETALIFDTSFQNMTIKVSRRAVGANFDQQLDIEEVVALH